MADTSSPPAAAAVPSRPDMPVTHRGGDRPALWPASAALRAPPTALDELSTQIDAALARLAEEVGAAWTAVQSAAEDAQACTRATERQSEQLEQRERDLAKRAEALDDRERELATRA